MKINKLKPRKALNKAFLKVKPNRTEIEGFKANLIQLLDRLNDTESEEFHKNLVIDFLKKSYYDPNHFVNTKGRNDLVIHNKDKAKSTVGVIIEAKKPTNKSEMITIEKLNAKAFQELVLYYLRERITQKNLEIKHLIITNINEWFIFNATTFDRLFAQNKKLVKQFNDFEGGRLADTKTDFFYKQIAEPFIADIKTEIEFTYFNLQDYQKPLRNDNKADDNKLIALFKLLSPEHLLKLPFTNDSNSLDKRFYSELLHIIGLTETKDGSKKLIERNKPGERSTGTILENAIIQLDSLDKISRLERPGQFGSTLQEKLFNVALELSITWINRILFLKLLEAQLITYHKGDKTYSFLNLDKIKNYDDLNSLFFQVLARKHDERNEDVIKAFEKVPYLNSSLFEPTDIEQDTLFISNLRDDKTIPILSQTVLKDQQGKKRTGNLNTLEYLFEFLNAYDFSSEGSEEIQEENKSLINASVLGLIFEKINGYKDGSFFTPGFITMYMCRETIRKAVVQKFNETKTWKCNDLEDIYDKIEDRKEANEIVNSLKICDPAVGSGHFLVSALNEMIAIKADLKILQDRKGRRLKEYQVEVVNDELIVTDEEGELFDYHPNNKESQRIQETLFHEKQSIIENCLFGVDINPNSVKICRLRLWIELLKNAYYLPSRQAGKNATELETLPNIDINIKCGNSLVSRFDIDADLKQALKKSKWSIDSYRIAVDTYRNAESKEQKREMERLIADIKSDFRSEISQNDPKARKLRKLTGELFQLTNQGQLFKLNKKEKAAWNKKVAKLTKDTKKLETEIEEIKANKIFENAFEWRFEFPEVLNDDGDFLGFDVVIGNPPYIRIQDLQQYEGVVQYYSQNYNSGKKGNYDIYVLFIELGLKIGIGQTTYILPHKFINAAYGEGARKLISDNMALSRLIHFGSIQIFDDATTYTCILFLELTKQNQFVYNKIDHIDRWKNDPSYGESIVPSAAISQVDWKLLAEQEFELLQKLNKGSKPLDQVTSRIFQGIKTSADKIFIVEEKSRNESSLKIECPHDGKSYEVETGLFYSLIKGGDSQRYFFRNSSLVVLFPYDGSKLIEEKILAEKYPLTYKYLSNHKKYLEQRESGRFKGAGWYQFGRHQAIDVISSPKIFTPDIAPEPHFMIDQSGDKYFTGGAAGGYGIVPKNLDSFYLLGVLNSSIVKWYISKTSTQMRGGWYSFESRFIKDIPIKSEAIILLDSIASKVKKVLQRKKDDSTIDITKEENEIDLLVYQLYELTEEEIKIIENSI
jgi:hypothetical protein